MMSERQWLKMTLYVIKCSSSRSDYANHWLGFYINKEEATRRAQYLRALQNGYYSPVRYRIEDCQIEFIHGDRFILNDSHVYPAKDFELIRVDKAGRINCGKQKEYFEDPYR